MNNRDDKGEIIIYQSDDKSTHLEVRINEETIWLTQKQMALLFDCSVDNVGLHLKNIYKEEELQELATAEDFSVVRQEGSRFVKRKVVCYNLDAVISVGYRVNSKRGTQLAPLSSAELRFATVQDMGKSCIERLFIRCLPICIG
jgi:hypothetical protein